MKTMRQSVIAMALGVATLSAPAHVLANNFVVGSSHNGNVTLNSSAVWRTIRSVTITIPLTDGATHGCVATASADMDHNGAAGIENQYRFVLSRNTTSPPLDTGSERILELVDNANADDPDSKPVSTTQHFTGLRRNNGVSGGGRHTFYFLGRKVQAGDANANVLDASLSVICVHTP